MEDHTQVLKCTPEERAWLDQSNGRVVAFAAKNYSTEPSTSKVTPVGNPEEEIFDVAGFDALFARLVATATLPAKPRVSYEDYLDRVPAFVPPPAIAQRGPRGGKMVTIRRGIKENLRLLSLSPTEAQRQVFRADLKALRKQEHRLKETIKRKRC